MKFLKKIYGVEQCIYNWLCRNKMINFILVLGIGNFLWLTYQCYQDYLWIINHTTPLKPVDFLILCVVVPLHWFIVAVVLCNYFIKHDSQVPNNLRHLFLLDIFYIAFRMHADMTTDESMAMHYLISFVNVVLLCGFNWACFYNCITTKTKER